MLVFLIDLNGIYTMSGQLTNYDTTYLQGTNDSQ